VSVCLPAFEAEPYLAATIDSVLAQSLDEWELIILDNGSSDRTGDIARSYDDPRITVRTNPETIPLADNWNAVISLGTAPYVKLLCADDLLAPDCLIRSVEVLERHPDVVMVASRRHFISARGEILLRDRGLEGLLGHNRPADVVERVVRSGINPIGWPSALVVRRADVEAVGGFDARWLHPIDLHLWLRLLSRGTLFGLEESLASFRVSQGSLTARTRDPGAQYRAMIRTFLDESSWEVGRLAAARGRALSRVEQVRVRLLFAAVNSRWRPLRRLPSLLLDRRSTAAPSPGPGVVGGDPAQRSPRPPAPTGGGP
jgi:hypothetical protein